MKLKSILPWFLFASISFAQQTGVTVNSGTNVLVRPTGIQFFQANANALLAPNYVSTINYPTGSFVRGTDGNVYRALTGATGVDPTTNGGANWELSKVTNSVTLNIPSRFSNFSNAWAFVKNASITSNATVTIQFADGTYAMGSSPYILNHPCGSCIRILGNTTTPANVVLNSTIPAQTSGAYYRNNWGMFSVYGGNCIGYIDGFTVNGPGVANYGTVGFEAFDHSSLFFGPHMVVQNFYAEVSVLNNSYADCDYMTVRNGGDGNFFAYNHSSISAQGCLSEGASTWYARSGAMIEFGSSIFAPNSTFRNNAGAQVELHWNSSAMLDGSTLSNTASGTYSINCNGWCNWQDTGVTYTNVKTPISQMVTADGFMRFGLNVPYALNTFGIFQFIAPNGTQSNISITEDGIAGGFLGFTPSSSIFHIATDGPEIDFNVSSNSGMVAGTKTLTMTSSQLSALAPLNIGNATAAGTNITRIKHGTVTLVSGTATVTDSALTTSSRIFTNIAADGGTVTSTVRYTVVRSSGSFSVTAKNSSGTTVTTDTSTLSWMAIEP